jgi:hypothetical protein
MLVKEVAFCPDDLSSHDYLRLPEILEDICSGYQETYGVSIHSQLSQQLVPTIVKFWCDEKIDINCVESALFYAYQKSKKENCQCIQIHALMAVTTQFDLVKLCT